jgi:hypothetical protein
MMNKRTVSCPRFLSGRSLNRLLVLFFLFWVLPAAIIAAADGWYLEGQPIIEKSIYHNDECYQYKLAVTNGSASGTTTWSDCGSGKCGGTYTGSMTWTPPPAFMAPGAKITFTMTAKTSVQNKCGSRSIGSGGWIKADGATIVKAIDATSPAASGTFTVPGGSPGAKMQLWATVEVANQNSTVTYNYVFRGRGSAPAAPAGAGPSRRDDSPGLLANSLPALANKEVEAFITLVTGNPVYVSADPEDMPPSQRKWVRIAPLDNKKDKKFVKLGKGWTVRTPAGSEAVITFKTTAFSILGEKTWFIVRKEEFYTPSLRETMQIFGNLLKGIASFYTGPGPGMSGPNFEPVIRTRNTVILKKGTNFVAEVAEAIDTVKLVEGQVKVFHIASGATRILSPGQQVTATASGLGPVSGFAIAAEKSRWSRQRIEAGGPAAAPLQLALEKEAFSPGEELRVHFTASADWPADAWIGIVPANIAHGSEAENDKADITFQHLNKRARGVMVFQAPNTRGTWDIRMHDTDANGREVAHVSFTVRGGNDAGRRLLLDKSIFSPGEELRVHFTASADWPADAWIGIVPAGVAHGSEAENDKADVAYQYLKKMAAGTLVFKAPAAPGEWTLRMNDSDAGGLEVDSIAFTVR